MNYQEDKFKADINKIKPAGYSTVQFGDESVGSQISFKKEDVQNNKIYTLSFGFEEYFPISVRIYSFNIGICYKEVEQVYSENKPADYEYGTNHSLESNSFYIGFNEEDLKKEYDFTLSDIEIVNSEMFNHVMEHLNEFITIGLEFLDEHDTLEKLYNFGLGISPKDRAFFYQDSPVRQLIVTALLQKKTKLELESLADQYINRLNQIGMPKRASFIQNIKGSLGQILQGPVA